MTKKRVQDDDYFVCPCCGADVRVGAKVCRECGASDDAGWGNEDDAWEADLPAGYGEESDFDYDEYVAREFPEQASPLSKERRKRLVLTLVAVIVCIALVVWTLAR